MAKETKAKLLVRDMENQINLVKNKCLRDNLLLLLKSLDNDFYFVDKHNEERPIACSKCGKVRIYFKEMKIFDKNVCFLKCRCGNKSSHAGNKEEAISKWNAENREVRI